MLILQDIWRALLRLWFLAIVIYKTVKWVVYCNRVKEKAAHRGDKDGSGDEFTRTDAVHVCRLLTACLE